MPAKLASKLKGIIFADRPAVRPGRVPSKDEAQAGLITEIPGPSSDAISESASKGTPQKPRLHWQKELCGDGYKREYDSTQQVHVWNDLMGGAPNNEPIRHYMHPNGSTPKRKARLYSDDNDDERVMLNVGGVRHETHVTTLRNVPNSRLSRLADLHASSGRGKQEYFFDRHPAVFNSIIDFYRTGELHVPLEVCGAVVKRELDFWQIEEFDIKACCWRHYRSYIENQRILNSFNKSLQHEQMTVDLSSLRGWKLIQTKIWLIMDHPRTSVWALIYGITSFLFVTASIAGFCLETLPELRPKITANRTMASCNGETKTLQVVLTSNEALNVLDFICTIFFTLELVLRFTVSPAKLRFIRNPMNIIDLLALVPLYVQVIFEQSDLQSCYMNERFVIEIMFILRIFRMFRIFHLVKHYQALKVLVYALRASLQELLMLFIFLLIAMLIFATMIYYAERSASEGVTTEFNTIPIGFWWAIITMTTVGYGDVTPVTPIGYIVGTACSVCGVLLVALTFPVISNNFTLFYEHVRSRSLSPRVKETEEDESCGEEEQPEFTPDYGAVTLKMHNLTSSSNGASNNGIGCHTNSVMNTNSWAQHKENGSKKSRYVPLAKFGDNSSMTDIVLQEPTDDLCAAKSTPNA